MFSDSILRYAEKSVISKPYAINCLAPINVSETLLQHSCTIHCLSDTLLLNADNNKKNKICFILFYFILCFTH